MSRTYRCPLRQVPSLPRQSIFSYLFPAHTPHDRDKPQFIDGLTGRSVSTRGLESEARRLAGGLRASGLRRGDVACVFGQNSLEWLNAVYGCLCAGIVVSPINYGYTPNEVVHQLEDSTASACFVSPALYPTLKKALELAPGVKIDDSRIIHLCPKSEHKPDRDGLRCISEVWAEEIEPEVFENGDEHKVAWLCYSSGTTGLAKGVATTHFNMTSQVQCMSVAMEQLDKTKDVGLGFLPYGHMYALALSVHQPLILGIPTIVLPRFDDQTVFRTIEKYRVTWALVVPPNLITMRNSTSAGKYDISSLRGVMSAAAPLSTELCQAVEKRFPNLRVTQAYGLTEISPITHTMTLQGASGRQGSIGVLIPHTTARLVKPETGLDVSHGQPGEIWIKSPCVMKGYWRNEAATTKTFHQGWFMTGDVAVVSDDGYFTIVDRLKELVKYKGYQVAPAELEGLLLTQPAIADAAVIGIHDDAQATELPRAYVVPSDTAVLQSQEAKDAFSADIVAWVQGRVANHKRLRGGCVVVDEVPKSPTGKILRKILRAMAAEEKGRGQGGRSAKL